MKRYMVAGIEGGENDTYEEEYEYGDWVKFEDAQNEIYKLQMEIDALKIAVEKVFDAIYPVR